MNKKGSILAICTGFVLCFSLLGFGAIYLSGLQSQEAEKKVASTKAFWLAEAGVDRAFAMFPGVSNITQSLVEGSYNVNITPENGYSPSRWLVNATGFVTPVNRTIQVEVEGLGIHTILNSTGPLILNVGNPSIDKNLTEANATFNFTDVFGINETIMQSIANYTWNKTGNETKQFNPDNLTNITWVNGTMSMNANFIGSGILIVNGDLNIQGGTFRGVIWVNGTLDIGSGNPAINGSIFVYVNATKEKQKTVKITGTENLTFDTLAIDQAFQDLSGYNSTVPHIILWREVD